MKSIFSSSMVLKQHLIYLIALITILISSCVITRPITYEDQRWTVPGKASWITSSVPGLSQALNGEYLKAVLLGGSSFASLYLSSSTGNEAVGAVAGAIYIYQYCDGVYSSYIFDDQKLKIMLIARENLRLKEIEKLRSLGLTDSELNMVERHRIWIGMPIEALYVSLGHPDNENITVRQGLKSIQHIYRNNKTLYVYSDNGRVTSWQE